MRQYAVGILLLNNEGKIITSGGISAGINMALHVVAKLCRKEVTQ